MNGVFRLERKRLNFEALEFTIIIYSAYPGCWYMRPEA